jgi:hypothetical protein
MCPNACHRHVLMDMYMCMYMHLSGPLFHERRVTFAYVCIHVCIHECMHTCAYSNTYLGRPLFHKRRVYFRRKGHHAAYLCGAQVALCLYVCVPVCMCVHLHLYTQNIHTRKQLRACQFCMAYIH